MHWVREEAGQRGSAAAGSSMHPRWRFRTCDTFGTSWLLLLLQLQQAASRTPGWTRYVPASVSVCAISSLPCRHMAG